MYVYNLPYTVRADLVALLNQDRTWERLAGTCMGYNHIDIARFQACKIQNQVSQRNLSGKENINQGTRQIVMFSAFRRGCTKRERLPRTPSSPTGGRRTTPSTSSTDCSISWVSSITCSLRLDWSACDWITYVPLYSITEMPSIRDSRGCHHRWFSNNPLSM